MSLDEKKETEKNQPEQDLNTYFFLSALSHEIRSPLNGIVGYNQLLLQTKVSPTQKTYLAAMNKCCIQLLELLNDIIDYSRLSIGKMNINKECFSIKEVTDVIDNTLNFRLKEKRQKFQWIISRNLPKLIVSDKQKIIQILVNLVSNASKFTDIGGFISVHISPKPGNKMEFTVKDTGCGISPENQLKLFDAFYQVEQSVSKTGSGLGLAISKKLVELLSGGERSLTTSEGGGITVDSTVGKGSSFSFTITHETQLEEDDVGSLNSLKGKYALVVDNDPNNRILLGEILFELRMKPIVCASALEAISLIIKQRYNFAIAIIDNDLELAKEIKKESPSLPLIGLTTSDSDVFDQVILSSALGTQKTHLLSCIQKLVKRGDVGICGSGSESGSNSGSPVNKNNVKILVTEDIMDNLTLTINMLESMGYTDIDTAVNGREAIQKLDKAFEKGEMFNILLLDLRMPVMDGFKVIEHVNKKGYGASGINIAVLTASVLDADRIRCKELGIKYFIVKPVEMIQLRNVMTYMTTAQRNQ